MPYYHVFIEYIHKEKMKLTEWTNLSKEVVEKQIAHPYMENRSFMFAGQVIHPRKIRMIQIFTSETPDTELILPNGRPFVKEANLLYILDCFSQGMVQGVNMVTQEFIHLPPKTAKIPFRPVGNKNKVFIVHGRDHKPMEELKAMLKEFGLNPIVLHEQPSGSRTIVEKLEKYSDVGYAFVILTPEDKITELQFPPPLPPFPPLKFKYRARQNVVLEFGYFIGKLNRDRVCCLLKGDVERPSDMHGIVYIHFKESIIEVRDKIVKELKAAGYGIKI